MIRIARRYHPLLLLPIGLLFQACAQTGLYGTDSAPVTTTPNPYGSSFNEAFGNALGKGSGVASNGQNSGVGSNPDGSLSSTDRELLSQVTDEMSDNNPQLQLQLDPSLAQRAQDLWNASQNPKSDPAQLAQMRVQLATDLLTDCQTQIEKSLAPQPLRNLEGVWESKACGGNALPRVACADEPGLDSIACKKIGYNKSQEAALGSMAVTEDKLSGYLSITGGHTGKLIADGNLGQGKWDAYRTGAKQNKWAGSVDQMNGAGTAKLKPSNGNCVATWKLTYAINRDVERMDEALRRHGQCMSRAAVLLSPAMAKMLSSVDKSVADLIRKQVLNLNN